MATYPLDINALPLQLARKVVAGDSLPLLMQLKINSTAVDLTNCTLYLDGTGPGGVAITGRSIAPSDAATGCFDGGLTAAETAAWETGTGRYQVQCVFPSGDAHFTAGATKTLLEVTVQVRADLSTPSS